MASIDKDKSLLLSDTLVPDLFIYHYMTNLTKEAICVFLYFVSNGSSKMTEDEINEISLFDKQTTEIAIAELIASGLMSKLPTGEFILVDIKKNEVDSYCASIIARGGAELSDLELSPLKKERDDLCDSISKSIYAGKMGYIFYRIVDKCLFDYEFETIVIYSLFDTAKERKMQYNYKQVEKLAEEWHKNGIKDANSLSSVLEKENRSKELIQIVGRITRKRVDAFDIERINKWVDLGFSTELIEFAFRSNSYRSTLRTKDVDDTLTKWVEAGINTLEAATKFESEQHKENKRKYNRNKANGTSNYRTGAEAGLVVQSDVAESVKVDSDSQEDSGVNDILNMFGGLDEDN